MYRLWKGQAFLFMTVLPVGESIFLFALCLQGEAKAQGAGKVRGIWGEAPFSKVLRTFSQVLGMPFAGKGIVVRGAIENIVDLPT